MSGGAGDMNGGGQGRTMARWGARLLALFISLRVTVVVLLLAFAATAAGSVISQGEDAAYYDQRFGRIAAAAIRGLSLDDVFHSWWFRLLLAAFFAQVLLCTIGRFRPAWVQLVRPGEFVPEGSHEETFLAVHGDVIVAEARRMGYREVAVAPVGSVLPRNRDAQPSHAESVTRVLVRGRLQPLGFLVLHVSLLAVLVGLTWNLSFGFSRALYLPEGQRVLDQGTNRSFELVELEPDYRRVRSDGEASDWELAAVRARIDVFDGGRLLEQGTLGLGSSLGFDRGDLVILPNLERRQVVFRIVTPNGTATVERLSSGAPEVALPGGHFALRVSDFASDADVVAGGWQRRSPILAHPLVAVSIIGVGGDGSETPVVAADLRPSASLEAEGFVVTFVEAVYMPVIVVSSRGGEWLILSGFVANLLGVVLSLGFSFRQLRVTREPSGWRVVGYARRRNQPLAEELGRLAAVARVVDGSDAEEGV